MIRTKQQRQADRDWCERFMDEPDTFESFGHGLVIATTVGALVWLIVALLSGWLA